MLRKRKETGTLHRERWSTLCEMQTVGAKIGDDEGLLLPKLRRLHRWSQRRRAKETENSFISMQA